MKPPKQRLEHAGAEDLAARLDQAHHLAGRRHFESPEELLRADREQMQVPEHLAERIGQSIAKLPEAPRPPWWKRLLS